MKPLLVVVGLLLSIAVLGQSPVVSLHSGKISGTQLPSGIQVFKGIPFAAPPVGDLRWKAPQPVQPWEEVKACTEWGPSPVQAKPSPFMFWSSEFLIPEEPISEDCLYLNVWSGAKTAAEKRPVLVYIYGGGFRSGGSGCPIYDGEAMAKKGVVFVSINYRVGVFGFLAHPELSKEAEYGSSGNYALLDMIAALQWVQQNIAAFGGDPGNVTIAGQSAGAFGVSFLTASPLAKGLVHRAIAQSGGSFLSSGFRPSITLGEAEKRGLEFAENVLNCKSLSALRAKSADEILQAQGALITPIVDGYVVMENNAEIYKQGKHNDVPLLMGWNGDDKLMARPEPAATFKSKMEEQFGDRAADFFKVYPADTEEHAAQSQFNLSRDQAFGIQLYTWAKLQHQHGKSKVFVYNFNRKIPAHTPETQFGAFHSGEVVYAYDNLHTLDRPWEPVDQQIADLMSDYWVNFARTGNPNGKGLPKWQAFTSAKEKVLLIDEKTTCQQLPDLKQLTFLEQVYKNQ